MSSQGEASINQGKASGVPTQVDGSNPQSVPQGEFARIHKCLETISEQFQYLNMRVQAVDSETLSQGGRQKGGNNRMGVDEKLGDDDREDDEFDHFTNEFPREAVGNDFNRGAAGRGRGLGRGHRRMQGNPTVGRHRGQDEGTGRHLGGVKLKLP